MGLFSNRRNVKEAYGGMAGKNPFDNMKKMAAGLKGSAEVKSRSDSGRKLAGDSLFDVVLEVTLPGEAPFEVTHRQVIAAAAMGRWDTGAVFPVTVDPEDRNQVMIG